MRYVRLGEVITLKRGYDLPTNDRTDGDVPVVASAGITGYHNESKVRAPGVVTGRYGTIGEVYYINQDFWPLNTALYVSDFQGNHPQFIAYFLKHALRGAQSSKAAVPGVNRNDLHELKVGKFDISSQKRIAEILSSYDELIENNRRRMAILESAMRLLYQEWFIRFRFPKHEGLDTAGGMPKDWIRLPISEIAACTGGGTPPTSVRRYWDGGDITWVTPTDVTNNDSLVLLDSERKVTADGLQNSSSKIVPDHAILMTSRASIGFFALAGRPVCTNQGFISIASHDPSLTPYLLFHLIARVEEIRALGAGSTFPEVSRGKFRNFNIVVPSADLISRFSANATAALSQIRILKLQSQKLRTARDLLLPRLMSGEIVP